MKSVRQPVSFVATSNPVASKKFYGEALGLNLIEDSPYAFVFSDGGIMLRMQIVDELHPASHTVHGWLVHDIEREIAELAPKGVTFLKFERMKQSDAGVWTTPDGNKIAWFNDPDGNILSLTQYAFD